MALRLAAPAPAATIYSNLQDIAIPLNLTGVYLDVDGGTTNTQEFVGWDINPFFGGVGVAGSPAFQPARIGAGNLDTIVRLAVGATVDVSRLFSTGYGGSQTHLGTQFTSGQEGYLGFKFTKNNATGPFYGWMRVVFTGNTAGAVIKDWAYDDGGSAIVTGRVLQSAPSGNAQVVTLSPGAGEAFTLGSPITNTGGNINSLLKTGTGTATLVTTNSYTGGTTVSGGVLVFAASQNLTALTIGAGAVVTLMNVGSAPVFPDIIDGLVDDFATNDSLTSDHVDVLISGHEGDGRSLLQESASDGDFDSNSVRGVPEPGSISLLLLGTLGLLGRRCLVKN